MNQKLVPVTLLTGYLGSGKTTVMNELLKKQERKKLALVVNDMGSINIDASLLKKGNAVQMDIKMIELQNGCICCTLRDEFMEQMEQLAMDNDIEGILVEASGISNPVSIADGFQAYRELHEESVVRLNSIVTVVDVDRIYAEFIDELIENQENTQEEEEGDPDIINLIIDQIEFCNCILLNKCDLLDREKIEQVKHVIRQIQADAKIIETVNGNVEADQILNGKCFDYEKVLRSSAVQKALEREKKSPDTHDEYGVSSFVYEERRPFQYDLFMKFVEQDYPETIIRAKGYLWFADDAMHVQLFEQAGRNASVMEVSNWTAALEEKEQAELFALYPDVREDWDDNYGDRLNQIVFIGRGYDKEQMIECLNKCLLEEENANE